MVYTDVYTVYKKIEAILCWTCEPDLRRKLSRSSSVNAISQLNVYKDSTYLTYLLMEHGCLSLFARDT